MLRPLHGRSGLFFGQPEQAEAAKHVLDPEAYNVDLQGQVDGSGVLLATPPAAHKEPALVKRMQFPASQLGGAFMGHGGVEHYPLGGHS
jgi:hypothetical protein